MTVAFSGRTIVLQTSASALIAPVRAQGTDSPMPKPGSVLHKPDKCPA